MYYWHKYVIVLETGFLVKWHTYQFRLVLILYVLEYLKHYVFNIPVGHRLEGWEGSV